MAQCCIHSWVTNDSCGTRAIAGFGGEWMEKVMGHEWGIVLGPLLFILGLNWFGWFKLSLPGLSFKVTQASSLWGAFLLGVPFSVAVCPMYTPALLVALTTSVTISSVPFGIALLFMFALGRSIPMAIGAWSIDDLQALKIFRSWQTLFEKSAGLTLMVTALYLMHDYFIGHG